MLLSRLNFLYWLILSKLTEKLYSFRSYTSDVLFLLTFYSSVVTYSGKLNFLFLSIVCVTCYFYSVLLLKFSQLVLAFNSISQLFVVYFDLFHIIPWTNWFTIEMCTYDFFFPMISVIGINSPHLVMPDNLLQPAISNLICKKTLL